MNHRRPLRFSCAAARARSARHWIQSIGSGFAGCSGSNGGDELVTLRVRGWPVSESMKTCLRMRAAHRNVRAASKRVELRRAMRGFVRNLDAGKS